MENVSDTFANRCLSDPPGVIKDLVEQTTRQAVEINRLMILTEGMLLPVEATHLMAVLLKQPSTVTRNFTVEDLEEAIVKKLQAIASSEKKVEKKKKKEKKS